MERVLRVLAGPLREMLKRSEINWETVTEIRLRVEKPLYVHQRNEEFFLNRNGRKTVLAKDGYLVTKANIRETMEYISNYSMYAFEEELRRGYITLEGGHRIGICGRAVLEQGRIKGIKHISGLNIRIAREVKGCADGLLPFLKEGGRIQNTLFLAPPGGGKTTMLRDVIRQISDAGTTVGIVDERSEIAACYQGIAQHDIGMRTDVLDGCPKAEGMLLMIRSMAPEVLAVDEIGAQEDVRALNYAISCGCRLLATMHAEDFEEIKRKPLVGKMIRARLFERYVLLERVQEKGFGYEILDGTGQCMKRKEDT